MPGRPRRSCDNCNGQKLRCCGQKPVCTRCRRLNRLCVYRGAAAATAGPPAARAPGCASSDVLSQSPLPPPPQAAGAAGAAGILETVDAVGSLSYLNIPEKRYCGVPEALITPLIDLYYTHIYNAPLLMRRPSLERAVQTNSIRTNVLLCICALAGKYYKDAKGAHVLVDNHFCREWAETAGRLALREVEFPTPDNVVVFLNLALYWYSTGDFQRSHIHSACAFNTAWILGVPPQSNNAGRGDPLAAEVRRRRFWGCYLLNCFQCDSLFPKVPTEAMQSLNLPCSEAEFLLPNPPPGAVLKSKAPTKSIFAELVRAMELWSAVVVLIRKTDWTMAERLVEMQKLDGRIHEAWAALDPAFDLDVAHIATAVPQDDLPRLLLLHIIYHQCFCSLHSSIVPLFSLGAYEGFSYAQQLSAQTAFEHANSVSALLQEALDLYWDAARMPSFIGYAAYCACAIQTPFLWCQQPDVKHRAARNILANLKTLQVLGQHWAFVKLLGRFACGLYRVHANGSHILTDEPRKMAPGVLNSTPPANSRARQSILTHNTIIVSDRSSVMQDVDDIDDISLETADERGAVSAEDKIANFISRITNEAGDDTGRELQTITDALLADNQSLGFQDRDGTFDWVMGGPYLDQFGLTEDRITEFLAQGL
ncbi:Zn(2)-C6 fungal-type DNA-binding domain protein [Niveomyces insectorum RCEF 264]|uniref:Zn(2)-C6 fungal-type DNA-binding domain protein n=1 Tax=Niveomyces insectorum RCEF 264 TaxID=1081102 RepID=A0A167ZX40_9HYPO|nr:Zn(2)-C6 fungal-type DNA-binding domain protein [Niveomyces insectorum RCEF 264]